MSTTPNNDAPASEALAAKSQQSGISGRMLAIFYLIAIVLGIVNGIWGSSATQSFACLLYTSPSPRDRSLSRMPSSA